MRHLSGLIGVCLLLCMSGCEIPGGASVPEQGPSRYAVQVPFKEVDFNNDAPPQSLAGLSVSVSADDIVPSLYYRYDVSSRVNGSYILLPNPPMIYTVRKTPFYKADTDLTILHINLTNTTGDVVRASQAVCSIDIDGKTVSSAPLDSSDLMPGHELSVQVQGPGSDQFGTKPNGTMTVWLYGLNGDKNQALHWQMDYNVKQQNMQVWGEVLGDTNSADDANRYKDKIEPAGPDAVVPPGG